MKKGFSLLTFCTIVLGSGLAFASGDSANSGFFLNLTQHPIGYICIVLFIFAYIFVIFEEFTHMRKSKPVVLAAGIIWGLIAFMYARNEIPHVVENAIRHNILEYAELFLFLLVAMAYINAMEERQVFNTLKVKLVTAGFSFRKVFWITGVLSFFISPIADNLTTALLMCAVVMAIGKDNKGFIGLACINIVVAANAGGAFSPFGDITTLMVWQKGIVEFKEFFNLFIPSVINWFIPAILMSFAVPNTQPEASDETVKLKRGAITTIFLFLCTITTAICYHNFLHLPPVVGMVTGWSYLMLFGFYLKKTHNKHTKELYDPEKAKERLGDIIPHKEEKKYDVYKSIARAEWDTLLFFWGVILCVGGLGFIGYLAMISHTMYTGWGATYANIMVGILSAIVDNIPVMFAVLSMNPDMSHGQWLLVTLTAGVGGSLLSVGSAAGVALMGAAKGRYTFAGHLKWSPVIALGYGASIYVHFLVNASKF